MAAIYGYDDPGTQALMLLDRARTAAFARAIEARVGPDDVVLDLGSGSGVLALLAARAGARRVYAVEQTAMAEVIRENALANGLADRVEVLRTPLEDLTPGALPDPPTVILSEMLGHFAPDEHGHRLYRIAARHSVASPTLIPASYRIHFGVANVAALARELALLEDCHGVRLTGLVERLRSRPIIGGVGPEELLGPEAVSGTHAFLEPRPERYEATVVPTRAGEANAIVASFESDLAPRVTLSTRPDAETTHWRQLLLPLWPPLPCEPGRPVELSVRPLLVTVRGTWAWSARSGDEVRGGDAMKALTATTMHELAAQLGLRLTTTPPLGPPNRRLRAFAAILGGPLDGVGIDALAERLRAAMPGEFPDAIDARDEVLELLRAARMI